MKFDTFFNWIWEIEFCDPMIGANEYITEIFPKEKKSIFLRIDSETKIKAYFINKEKKLNEDEQIIEFNKEKFGYNNKYNLLLKNINNNENYENDEGNNALIYEILNAGDYLLEIISINSNKKEEDYIYIKIHAESTIAININDPNNYNIKEYFHNDNKYDLSNEGIFISGCKCILCTIKQNHSLYYFPPSSPSSNMVIDPEPPKLICPITLFEKYLLIEEIIFETINLCIYFKNIFHQDQYDFNGILPPNNSTYNYSPSKYNKNPHIYYHYIETKKGFICVIINKYKFNWNYNSKIEYNIEKNEFMAYFEFGSFKVNSELMIYDFDEKFKNLLLSTNYIHSYLYLRHWKSIEIKLSSTIKKSEMEIKQKENSIKYLEKLSFNLETSKINFINISGSSCYQSSTLQGFVHIIYPIAIRNIIFNINQNRYKGIDNIDKFKNNNEFNDMIIDILKDLNNRIEKGEQKAYKADKLFNKFPPKIEFHQGIENIADCNKLHINLQNSSMNTSSLIGEFGPSIELKSKNDNDLIQVINIEQNTIITEIMKIKIEGNQNYVGNLILKIDDDDIKDKDLNIFKLLRKCPQLNINNNYSHKKIELISDIIYMVIDRISGGKDIKKQFNINEKIYFDKASGNFQSQEDTGNFCYELKFIVYHKSYGHYIAYSKIKDDWYFFNDLGGNEANIENPPLTDKNGEDIYPVVLYYVKKIN